MMARDSGSQLIFSNPTLFMCLHRHIIVIEEYSYVGANFR